MEVASIHQAGTEKCADLTLGEIQFSRPLNVQVSEKTGVEEKIREDMTFTTFSTNLV